MQKQEVSDRPLAEEQRGPLWTPPVPPEQGGRAWLGSIFERFGFLIALGCTLLVLAALFINTDILLRGPDTVSRAAPESAGSGGPDVEAAPVDEPGASEGEVAVQGEPVLFAITTEPTSAAVFVDGAFLGITPLRESRLSKGAHRISVQKQDYAPLDTLIVFHDDAMSLVFTLMPVGAGDRDPQRPEPSRPEVAALDATNRPGPSSQRAAREEAAPPASSPSRPSAEQAGRDDRGIPAREAEGAGTRSNRENTPPAPRDPVALVGEVQITSQPSGATILLDGREVGVTPALITGVEAGTRRLSLRLDGFDDHTSTIAVAPSQRVEVNRALAQRLGTLKILAKPWGNIYIDGTLHKTEANFWYTTQLPPGDYRVRVEHPALGKWEQIVVVSPEEEKSVTVDFNAGNSSQ